MSLGRKIKITHSASAVGHEEFFGPLGDSFDFHDESDRFGAKSWEQAEGELERITLNLALKKAKLKPCDIDLLFAGDLQNQCVASSSGLSSFGIPYIGLYGACSTCAEAILCASVFLSAQKAPSRCVAITSSHNCAAERQFRTPIEYGGQRTPTAQWTATAAGAFIIENCFSKEDAEEHSNDLPNIDSFCRKTPKNMTFPKEKSISLYSNEVFVTEVMAGKIIDSGVSDASNMGAAMAPACAHSLEHYFKETKRSPSDFDCIVTGDLGKEGSEILYDLLSSVGISIKERHLDCGMMMYDYNRQDVHSGGSGCGCSASILSAHFLPSMRRGDLKNVLFLATGALMSPSSIQQGGTIAGIAPLLRLEI